MTEAQQVDVVDVRVKGEEIYARLFPRPQQVFDPAKGTMVDGPTPAPRPVEVSYEVDGRAVKVYFVVKYTFQPVGEPAPDVPPTMVLVAVEDEIPFVADLEFGKEPEVEVPALPWLTTLLRAVTGVL